VTEVRPPAPAPCGSCPYRRDVPSGVWDEAEYAKLPEYDGSTGEQPPTIFLCHQQDGCLCAGWTATHDMDENLGLRLALSTGTISEKTYDAALDYETRVAVFASGAEAAEHGRKEIEAPSSRAVRAIDKLSRKVGA
jgi:hypothetical protein